MPPYPSLKHADRYKTTGFMKLKQLPSRESISRRASFIEKILEESIELRTHSKSLRPPFTQTFPIRLKMAQLDHASKTRCASIGSPTYIELPQTRYRAAQVQRYESKVDAISKLFDQFQTGWYSEFCIWDPKTRIL